MLKGVSPPRPPGGGFQPPPPNGAAPVVANAHASTPPAPPPNMVYVPGGDFWMGNGDGDELQRPPHKISVRPFFMDKYEVTCGEYEKYVAETGVAAPPEWVNGRCPPGASRRPVTGVDWYSACSYAAWAGKRLPTEPEWEFAARGTDGRLYPWGNEWKPNAANADATSRQRLANVGEYEGGSSPFGIYDLVGNAWEWTADELAPYSGGPLPQRLATGETVVPGKVVRGGYWGSLKGEDATATFRTGYSSRGKDYSNVGFRCAKDVTL